MVPTALSKHLSILDYATRVMSPANRPVGDALRYFQNRLALMNYADARKHGLPIGSGAVEATCKSLVSIRMKHAGARWKHQSGNEILQLRALQLL